MRSSGINGDRIKWQLANPGVPGNMVVKMECVFYISPPILHISPPFLTNAPTPFRLAGGICFVVLVVRKGGEIS